MTGGAGSLVLHDLIGWVGHQSINLRIQLLRIAGHSARVDANCTEHKDDLRGSVPKAERIKKMCNETLASDDHRRPPAKHAVRSATVDQSILRTSSGARDRVCWAKLR